MRLYLVAYQSHQAEFVGAAIVRAFDEFKARETAEADGIHQPGMLSVVTRVDGVPPELIGRKLSLRDVMKIVTRGPKKPKPARFAVNRPAGTRTMPRAPECGSRVKFISVENAPLPPPGPAASTVWYPSREMRQRK